MKQLHYDVATLTIALLVAIVSIPLTSQAIFRSQDEYGKQFEEDVPNIIQKAKEDARARQLQSRRYHEAIELFRERLKRGETDLVKPEINDTATVDFYFGKTSAAKEESHAAASASSASSSSVPSVARTMETISKEDRALLRRYERAKYCPESLKTYASGFYELCVALTGEKRVTSPRIGIINDLARLKSRSVLPKTLNSRLEMLRQAREGTKRESVTPMRTAAPVQ